jgi:hypothetical protein
LRREQAATTLVATSFCENLRDLREPTSRDVILCLLWDPWEPKLDENPPTTVEKFFSPETYTLKPWNMNSTPKKLKSFAERRTKT